MSDEIRLYGETDEEKLIREKKQCRLIVKEILDFGITDRQKYQIIKLMAENLESFEHMKRLVDVIDELTVTDVGDLLGGKEKVFADLAKAQDETGESNG